MYLCFGSQNLAKRFSVIKFPATTSNLPSENVLDICFKESSFIISNKSIQLYYNSFINDFNSTTRKYYNDIKKYQTITIEEERDLIRKAKENNIIARNKLITSNLKFVINVAKQFRGRGVAMQDLISEGNLGLLKAIDKFDESKDVKFISAAETA